MHVYDNWIWTLKLFPLNCKVQDHGIISHIIDSNVKSLIIDHGIDYPAVSTMHLYVDRS